MISFVIHRPLGEKGYAIIQTHNLAPREKKVRNTTENVTVMFMSSYLNSYVTRAKVKNTFLNKFPDVGMRLILKDIFYSNRILYPSQKGNLAKKHHFQKESNKKTLVLRQTTTSSILQKIFHGY